MKPEELEDDKLNEIAPSLSKMSRQHPFTAPDGYFDSLPTIITERITAEKEKPWLTKVFEQLLQPKFTAALAALVLAAGAWWYLGDRIQPSNEIALTYTDLAESEFFYDLDEQLLVEELAENTSSETGNTDLENYLLENETDIDNLINEL